jgi:multiple sugar transport system permease protein
VQAADCRLIRQSAACHTHSTLKFGRIYQEVNLMAGLSVPLTTSPPKLRKPGTMARREAILFWICVSPWIIGFLFLEIGPMLYSLYLSFTRWTILTPPVWIGLKNYTDILTADPDFFQSLKVTLTFAIFSIPLRMVVALFLAVLLNEATRLVGIFRTAFYIPAIVSSVAAAVLWTFIFNPRYGPVNGLFGLFNLPQPSWFQDPKYALWGLIIMSVWGVGGEMLIFLAALKGISHHLYEAAELDGAGRLARFLNITIPSISPALFFNFVMSVIGAFQTFDSAYVISTARAGTLGGPIKSTLFYMLYTYNNAFQKQQMGYASALGWILVVIIFILTVLTIRSSSLWVFYESERKG